MELHMMNLGGFSSIVLLSLMMVMMMNICYSEGYNFYVGGKDGWVLYPSENYNHWAQRNRFQLNDTLIFKYKSGCDSILVVNKDDYYKCNKASPIEKLSGDLESRFTFTRTGPFFFISGRDDNCEKGQKLIIIVLAVRDGSPVPSPATPLVSPPPGVAQSPNNANQAPSRSSVIAPAPAKADAAAVGGSWVVAGLSSMGMSVVLGGLVGLF